MTSESIQGFKIFPLMFSANCTSCHNVFIKEHTVRTHDEQKPSGLTLFVLNIPPYATEAGLKNAFSNVGKIKRIILEDTAEDQRGDGFKRAFIVFNNRESLLKALKLQKLNPISSDIRPVKVGLEKWIEEYNKGICNPEELQEEINTFMAKYDEGNQNQKEETLEDEEGWTLVTKTGRRPGLSRKESLENKLNDKSQKATKKKELKNFYTFQIRESKMKNIVDLRKKFEEAKQKVQLMKQARKFKPY
ncbi:unnamed protein product [Psylliodes chrysocephalus]|uniref:RRM domain-containing protein n=1 Tax=Psylliodes chrysocephalus TaxID=3402493 RepID=A0A9P0GFD7_9CUCU|nr:unnamed protein product [Psylliodes chrysocephala]